MKSTKKITFCESMAQAASLTGIRKDFQRWAKSQGSHAFKSGRVYLDALRKYWEENQETFEGLKEDENDGSTVAVNKERIIMLQKQQRKLDLEYEIQREILVSKDAVKERVGKMIGAITGILKSTLSKQDYNAVAAQFQGVNFNL